MGGRDCRPGLYMGELGVTWLRQRESRYVGAVPAVHRLVADVAVGVASLAEGQVSHDQFVFAPAMRTLVDRHRHGRHSICLGAFNSHRDQVLRFMLCRICGALRGVGSSEKAPNRIATINTHAPQTPACRSSRPRSWPATGGIGLAVEPVLVGGERRLGRRGLALLAAVPRGACVAGDLCAFARVPVVVQSRSYRHNPRLSRLPARARSVSLSPAPGCLFLLADNTRNMGLIGLNCELYYCRDAGPKHGSAAGDLAGCRFRHAARTIGGPDICGLLAKSTARDHLP
jgi:hypothetical protein